MIDVDALIAGAKTYITYCDTTDPFETDRITACITKQFSIDDPSEKNCIDLELLVKRKPLITVPVVVAATKIAGDPPFIVV